MNFDFPRRIPETIELDAALSACRRAALVDRADGVGDAYHFKHVLMQETAYESLLRQDRRELHRAIAFAYEFLFAEELEEYLALLAHHYTQAGDHAQAAQYWTRYGQRALQISAFPEAIHAFEHALDLLPQAPNTERARVYAELGDVYCRRTEYDAAQEYFRQALTTAIAAGDAKTAATALSGVARIASQRGEHTRARELGQEALRWAQDAQDAEAIARSHRQLGVSYNYEGANELAQEHLNAALALYETLDDRDGIASCLNSLGVVAREQKDYVRAQECFAQALALSRALNDRYSVGIRLVNLGVLAEQRGDIDGATQYQLEALEIAREIGDREGAALIASNLGSLAQTRGDLETAQREFQAALSEARALGLSALALYTIANVAKLEAARGDLVGAAELLGFACENPATTADIALDFQDVREELERALGATDFHAAYALGATLQLQDIFARLLEKNM